MALFIAGSIGLFSIVARGWYSGITYLKDWIINNKIIKNNHLMIDHQDNLLRTCEEIDILNMSDEDTEEPILFYDPLPIGIMYRSSDQYLHPSLTPNY